MSHCLSSFVHLSHSGGGCQAATISLHRTNLSSFLGLGGRHLTCYHANNISKSFAKYNWELFFCCRGFHVLSPCLFAVAANISYPYWLLPLPLPSSSSLRMLLLLMFMLLDAWNCLPCPSATASCSHWTAVFGTQIDSSTSFFFNIAFNH
jgi:hypothetical protein